MSQNAPTSAFLQRIHHLDERYRYLDQLYVKPRKYDHIVQILETHGVVFIVGDRLIGKTYTAAYLMYQYFKRAMILSGSRIVAGRAQQKTTKFLIVLTASLNKSRREFSYQAMNDSCVKERSCTSRIRLANTRRRRRGAVAAGW